MHVLFFGNGSLLSFICLILLLPLFPSPVVDKSPCATGSFEILHLFRGGIHPDLVRSFHPFALSLGPGGSFAGHTTWKKNKEGYQEALGIPRLRQLDGLLLKDFLQTDQKSVRLVRIQTDHVIGHIGRVLINQ